MRSVEEPDWIISSSSYRPDPLVRGGPASGILARPRPEDAGVADQGSYFSNIVRTFNLCFEG
jgi:hypothetical protein